MKKDDKAHHEVIWNHPASYFLEENFLCLKYFNEVKYCNGINGLNYPGKYLLYYRLHGRHLHENKSKLLP